MESKQHTHVSHDWFKEETKQNRKNILKQIKIETLHTKPQVDEVKGVLKEKLIVINTDIKKEKPQTSNLIYISMNYKIKPKASRTRK